MNQTTDAHPTGTDDAAGSPGVPVPAVRVLAGEPTAEELAALVAVLAAAAGGPTADEGGARGTGSGWVRHAREPRPVPPHGRGGWQSSARPR